MYFAILIFTIIISVFLSIHFYKKYLENKEKDRQQVSKELENAIHFSEERINKLEKSIQEKEEELNKKNEKLNILSQEIGKQEAKKKNALKELSMAVEIHAANLEEAYEQAEDEYDYAEELLQNSYEELQKQVLEEQKELEVLKSIRFNALAAKINERKEKEAMEFYRLHTPKTDQDDISLLLSIKDQLHNTSLVLKLIWSTFRQKQLKELFTNILGQNIHQSGIYKITNIITDEVYIGQCLNFYDRWMTHAKCACGVGTGSMTLLYKKMQEYGIDNFTWEVLEVCSPDKKELDLKEKEYINLFCAYEYGMNSTSGNG